MKSGISAIKSSVNQAVRYHRQTVDFGARTTDNRVMAFTEHPLRRWAVDEMHMRRFAPVPPECDIYQAVRLLEADERDAEDAWLLHNRPDFDDWTLAPRHGMGHTNAGIYFLWERHTEASTLTLILPQDIGGAVRLRYIRWLEQWPGVVVRATRIFVIPEPSGADAELARLGISLADLVCCDINGGLRLWSDFGIHGDGYGRLVISAGAVDPGERGRIIQRLQELGNYRNLALLGFPVVQEYGPQLDRLEATLASHAKRVALAGDDDETLLNDLSQISSELELIRSATGFRLSATAAYAEVAADRLAALDVRPIANYQSLKDFTERRLVPASRTCSVFRARLGHIAERISGVMHMLDVRIDSRIKAQNLQLMQSMERSTQLQFRLQTLVESLSIIAAAYYLIGLIAYVVKGVAAFPSGSRTDLIIGAITLPVVLLIYALLRVIRHRVLGEAPVGANNATSF
jgi:uncharacterized membrane-anchored protein